MITDNDKATGSQISESGPIKGAEDSAGKYLDPVRLSGKSPHFNFQYKVLLD